MCSSHVCVCVCVHAPEPICGILSSCQTETWPESEYLASLPEYQYLTKELAEYWQSWVPNFPSAALATIAEGGYYSMEIMEGLRLLSFNSDYGYAEPVL